MTNTNIISRVNVPYRLSVVAMAVIGINAATLSNSVWAEDVINLDAITVTGEKVDKDIKDTTTAVTVITEEQYESGEIKQLHDLAKTAPNVTDAGYGAVSIRGISATGASVGGYSFVTGARPRISTVVDDQTESWSGYNFTPTDLWDTQKVEVLRGPQSTTQGTNSIGGAVVVKTNDPTFEQEAAIRLGIESYKNGNIKNNAAVMVSGPLIDDELAYRIAIDGTKGEGYMNYYQTASELDDGPDVDDSKNINVRGKLLWKPKSNDKLTAKLTVNHRTYEGEYLNWSNDSSSNYSSRDMTISSADRENIRLEDSTVDSIAADIDYKFSDSITNSLHLAYSETDVSFDEYPGTTLVFNNDVITTLENRVLFSPQNSDFSGLVGLYISQDETDLDVYSGDAVDSNKNYDSKGTTTTTAAYGEATYKINSKARLTAGVRVENEDVDRTLVWKTNTLDTNSSDTVFLPKVEITYATTKNTTLGASVRKGYNAGGEALNWDTAEYYTYDKEEVTAYELSSKTRYNNGITLNTSLFYNDYTDYQAFVDANHIENVSSAATYGGEVEVTAWVTPNTQLRGSLGLLDSKVKEDNSSNYGDELPTAPHTNIGVGFTQLLGESWSFGSDIAYVGSYYSDLENDEDKKAGDYFTADARVQYIIGNLTIDGYIKNLTNEDIVYYVGDGRASVGQTRTIGLSATYRL
ncbi:TonB-dependent receptor [Marinomonas sp.]|uniref:TonB-dependent receptor n=1 Tax=Marinomonas sp. TaxID=1904862 RepID=UPI003F9E6056